MAKARKEMIAKVDSLVPFKSLTEMVMERVHYGDVSPETVLKIKKIEAEFSEVSQKFIENQPGANRARGERGLMAATLEQEREQALKAALSPHEFREYELRSSRTARGVINELSEINVSEAEYVALFDAKKAWDDDIRNRVAQSGNVSVEGVYSLDLGSRYIETLGAERAGAVLKKKDRVYRALLELGGGDVSAAKMYTQYHDITNTALAAMRNAGGASISSVINQAEIDFRNSLPNDAQKKLFDSKLKSVLRAQLESAVCALPKK